MNIEIKSEHVYSPQEYLEVVTGKYYTFNGEDDVKEITKFLKFNNIKMRHYPLSKVGEAAKDGTMVVLVECMVVNSITDEFERAHVWFEVPDDFEETYS